MKDITTIICFTLCCFTLCLGCVALAQVAWQPDGVPVCTAAGDQQNPVIVPDLKGGGIVVWQDGRRGNLDLYAQRVDSLGNRLWANDGVAIAASGDNENEPRAVSDMRGGAIVVFNRGSYDVWAQRVDSGGNACWGANGVDVSGLSNSLQMSYRLCTDNTSGAIISWSNNDTFSTNGWDVYLQRIISTGNLIWGPSGRVAIGGANNQQASGIVEDYKDGCILFWRYDYPGLDFRFFADRIDSEGNLSWTLPAAICTTSGEKYLWNTCNDGQGGGLAVFKDRRNGNWDIYSQRVDSAGNVRWQTNGVPVCTAVYSQEEPVIAGDGQGGAIISWNDSRTITTTHWDIYAQRLDSLGNALWDNNGIKVCQDDSMQAWPCVTATDTGKAVISWFDTRSGQYDVYAQAVDGDGSLGWTSAGLAVCTAGGYKLNDIYNRQNQVIAADGSGGVILVWHDGRNGNEDIYAQKLRGLTGVTGEPPMSGKISRGKLRVWPNPFRGQAMVEGGHKVGEVSVYDIGGRLVERTAGRIVGKGLGSGVYFAVMPGYRPVKIIKLK